MVYCKSAGDKKTGAILMATQNEELKASSKRRKNEQWHSRILQEPKDDPSHISFLAHESDQGVLRNGGRIGAAHGPLAIYNNFLKFQGLDNYSLSYEKLSSRNLEKGRFEESQITVSKKISNATKKNHLGPLFHLGGGHDAIYPLLKAHDHLPKMTIINIDAHLDTRNDQASHSGTPFRQFSNEYKGELKLYQVGIHSFANPKTNYQKIKGIMKVFSFQDIQSVNQDNFFNWCQQNLLWEKDEWVVFSLDCDALNSSIMEGVSAVNPNGLSSWQVETILSYYLSKISSQQRAVIGLYEYNPIFDNLNQKGSRYLASLLLQALS
jgi:formiminoglutamase